jgi:hypothetical protein
MISNRFIQESNELVVFVFDIAALCVDSLPEEQRASFAKADLVRTSDPILSFILGHRTSIIKETWLGIVMSLSQPTSTQSQTGTPISSQQSQSQSQQQIRPGTTRPPVVAGTPPSSQSQASQRGVIIGNRPPGGSQSSNKAMAPPISFPLKPWEMLSDQGNTAAVNDTAISLALFGARKV